MRKVILVVLAVILGLSFVFPTLAAPAADSDQVKLRVFVHYPRPGRAATVAATCDPTSTDPTGYGLTGWHLPSSFTYRVNYTSIPSTVTNPATAIRNSFATWARASGVTLSEGAPTTVKSYKRDGQNIVVWGTVPSGAIAVTYTWYNSTTGQAVEIDTVMGKRLPWKNTQVSNPDATCGPLNAYDVQNILTHEVGHWLGLDDLYASVDHDLTMYGYGSLGELKKDTLATGDTTGINAIY